jgi:hypothetical protein
VRIEEKRRGVQGNASSGLGTALCKQLHLSSSKYGPTISPWNPSTEPPGSFFSEQEKPTGLKAIFGVATF